MRVRDVVRHADVEQVFGASFSMRTEVPTTVEWHTSTTFVEVIVGSESRDVWNACREKFCNDPETGDPSSEDVEGLGDAAYTLDKGASLYVLVGDTVVTIRVPMGPSLPSEAMHELAQRAVARLRGM